jgi:hypothetical protein
MTLREIVYFILEPVKSFKLVDDEEIDIRMVKAWIKAKRAELIKNKANAGQDINLNNAQSVVYDITSIPTYTGIQSQTSYFCGKTQDYTIYRTTEPLPSILTGHFSPLVLELTSEDMMQYPFSFVPFSQLRFSGNGRFNTNLIYGSMDVDKYLYLKTNDEFIDRPSVTIKAVFEDPEKVPGFDEEVDEYPCSLDLIELIKKAVFDIDLKVMLRTIPLEDDSNDANDGV